MIHWPHRKESQDTGEALQHHLVDRRGNGACGFNATTREKDVSIGVAIFEGIFCRRPRALLDRIPPWPWLAEQEDAPKSALIIVSRAICRSCESSPTPI